MLTLGSHSPQILQLIERVRQRALHIIPPGVELLLLVEDPGGAPASDQGPGMSGEVDELTVRQTDGSYQGLRGPVEWSVCNQRILQYLIMIQVRNQ